MIVDKLKNVYCIDTMLNNERNAVCSYIIESERVCIVDCGPTASTGKIVAAIDELGMKGEVHYIAVTHVHLDHGGGAGSLLKHFPNAKVLVHPKGFRHLINPSKLWEAAKKVLGEVAEIYQPPEPCERERVIAIDDNQTISLGDCSIRVLFTPGHAPHHASFYLPESDILFSGDSAGMYYKGMIVPTTPPPFDFEKSIQSIERMIELDPKTIAFTHFGFGEGEELRKIYKKTAEWLEVAKSVVKNNGDIEDLYNKIFESDTDFKKLLEAYRNSKIVKTSYMLGFRGLIDYVRTRKNW